LHTNLIALNGEVGNLNRELQKKTVELEKLSEQKSRFLSTVTIASNVRLNRIVADAKGVQLHAQP